MSSNIKEQLEIDIFRFFEQIESQGTNDRKQTLRNLLDKYIHLTKADHLMDAYDFREIIGHATSAMANDNLTRFLPSGPRKVKVSEDDMRKIIIIEATIGHLNKNDCLKRMPKFNYQPDKF